MSEQPTTKVFGLVYFKGGLINPDGIDKIDPPITPPGGQPWPGTLRIHKAGKAAIEVPVASAEELQQFYKDLNTAMEERLGVSRSSHTARGR